MNGKPFRQILIFVFILFFANCAQKTAIKVTKPAEIDAGSIQRLAVIDFRGPGYSGANVASVFTSKLFETGFYTMIERAELKRILDEHALSLSGVVDMETAIQAGNILGVQGVIVGDVIGYRCDDRRGREKVKEKVWTGDYEKDANGNVIYEKTLFGKVKKKKYREEFVDVEVIDREANVTLSFRLINVETGQIVASREASHSYTKRVRSGETSLPPANEILGNLGLRCVDEFVQMLAPHQVTVQTQFAKGSKEVNNGIEFAQNGLWDKAQAVWEEVLQKDPQNDAAWYNLGLAAEAQGYYLEAQDAYDQAVALKPKKLYMESLKRIREHIEDYRKLQEQLRKQNQAQPDEDM